MFKKILSIGLILFAFGFMSTLSSCTYSLNTVEQHAVAIRTSVQVAVVEFLKYNPKYIDRVIEITSQIVEDSENRFQTLKAAKDFVISQINFDNLKPAEKILVLNLVDSLEIEVKPFYSNKN
ncbi:MAG: hypothetical protein KatS3mg002_0212 [Candidatus Woesearchaeota archaeon]|nr:MAG: hypothetical protein KatS3mg002_0212 [Candidatus Woesearchaeota archaeon]